ncbi:MAG: substrate-binding domain-containing protein [Propionibacteriaceae bacterium]|jgi:ribose transport system substrate-binding protein|nr:substrate-binding domain-containing protein [Propionibacteriaceae bacterium]
MRTIPAPCLAALALAACLPLAACTDQPATGVGSGSPTVIIVGKSSTDPYWQAVQAGAAKQAAAEKFAVEYEAPASADDVDAQDQLIARAVAANPAAIAVAPIDADKQADTLKQIVKSGTLLVVLDTKVAGLLPLTTAATDNEAAGSLAALQLCNRTDAKGTVAVLADSTDDAVSAARVKGLQQGMQANCPNVVLLDPVYADRDAATAEKNAKAALATDGLTGLFTADELSGVGAIKAVEAAKAKTVLIGFDSGKDQIAAIRSGVMTGAISQNPVGIGQQAVSTVAKALAGKSVPREVDTGFYWYDKTNIDKPAIQAVLYD